MVVRHAWATKVQSTLDLPHAKRVTVLKQEPVDSPSFASKGVLKLCLIISVQSARRLEDNIAKQELISPIVGTFCSYNVMCYCVVQRALSYLTTRTEQGASLMTPSLTLPKSSSLILLKPVAPITIKLKLPSLATLRISWTA